ncbi:hypothetical protein FHG87_003759 [Trinorchestia longiramus]|nr:hypothetical protein FHG87_003759 [Trinorchestia longiramus]
MSVSYSIGSRSSGDTWNLFMIVTGDGVQLQSRPDNFRTKESGREPPFISRHETLSSALRERQSGPQERSPQRNLIQMIEEVIKAPYTGPVVTSMSAFLSRNSLSRPVRESIRKQLREAPPFNLQNQRIPSSSFRNTRSPGSNSALSRTKPNRSTKDEFELRPFDIRPGSSELSLSPSIRNTQKQQTFSFSSHPESSAIRRDHGQFQTFQSNPHSQLSSARERELNPFQSFRSNPNEDDGGFRVIDPPPRSNQDFTRFQAKASQSKSISSSSSYRNSDASFTNNEAPINSAVPFSFQNGVFSHQFESKRMKRNAKNENTLSIYRDGRQFFSPDMKRRQSNSDQSYIGSIGSMFTRFTDTVPTTLSDVVELFGFETEDRIDTKSSSGNGKLHDRRRFDGRQPLPVPVSIPARPSYMIIPQHPVKHAPFKRRHKRNVNSGVNDTMESEPTRRVERLVRRPERVKKSPDHRSIFRLEPIEISSNLYTGPTRGNIPFHEIRNLRPSLIRKDPNILRSSLPIQLPSVVDTSFIHNIPNQLSGSPARLRPILDTSGVRNVPSQVIGSPSARLQPIAGHSLIHNVPNRLPDTPSHLRHISSIIDTTVVHPVANHIISDKTQITEKGKDFNLITHKPKGIPPIETSSPAVIYNDALLKGREAPLVEVNFEDLPVLDYGRGNPKRLREIEELIRMHNDEINGVHKGQVLQQRDLRGIKEDDHLSKPRDNLLATAIDHGRDVNPTSNAEKSQVFQFEDGLGVQRESQIKSERVVTQPGFHTGGATGFSNFQSAFPVFPAFDFTQNFQTEFNFKKNVQRDFGASFFELNDVNNSIDITKGEPHDLESLVVHPTPSIYIRNDLSQSQILHNGPSQIPASQRTKPPLPLLQYAIPNSSPGLPHQVDSLHRQSTPLPSQHSQQLNGFPLSLPIQRTQLHHGPPLHHSLVKVPPVSLLRPHGAGLHQRTPHPTVHQHLGRIGGFHQRPLFFSNPHRRNQKSDGAATELDDSQSNVFRPGPAPSAGIPPSLSKAQAPADVVRKNRRQVRKNKKNRLQSGMKNRNYPKRNKRSNKSLHPELSFPQDLASQFFSESFDTPLAKEGSDGFMQEQNPMPDFASLGGFGPMDEASQREASEFKPHFRVPVVEVAEEKLEQPHFGPDSFPARQDFPTQGKRKKRSAPVSPYSRSVSDSNTSNSNHHQQPLVSFESFSMFNFPKFGERNSRELGGSSVSRSTNQRGSLNQRRHQAASTYQQTPSTRSSPSTLRSRSGEAQQYHPREGIYKAEGQRIYPSFNGGRSSFSRPAPAHTARSASNRRPFYPSQKLVSGPKSRSSSNTHNSLPNGFRDFHETFYGHRDKQRPGSHSHRQDDFSPVDNSLLGSGNFEVLSGGTFYDDDGGGGGGAGFGNQRHPYDSFLDHGYPYNEGGHYNQPHSNNYVDDFFSNFRDFSEFAVRRSDRDDRDDFFGGHASENTEKIVPLSPSELKRLSLKHDNHQTNWNISDSEPKASAAPHALHRPPRNIQEVLELEEAESSNMETAALSVDEKDPLIATF